MSDSAPAPAPDGAPLSAGQFGAVPPDPGVSYTAQSPYLGVISGVWGFGRNLVGGRRKHKYPDLDDPAYR